MQVQSIINKTQSHIGKIRPKKANVAKQPRNTTTLVKDSFVKSGKNSKKKHLDLSKLINKEIFSPKNSIEHFKRFCVNLERIKKHYKGKELEIVSALEDGAKTAIEKKKPELASIFYSINKRIMTNIPLEQRDAIYCKKFVSLINDSIKLSESQGDSLHALSRMFALSDFFAANKQKNSYINTLKKQSELMKNILKDVPKARANFKSVNRKPATEREIKSWLAKTEYSLGVVGNYNKTLGQNELEILLNHTKTAHSLYKKLNMPDKIEMCARQETALINGIKSLKNS